MESRDIIEKAIGLSDPDVPLIINFSGGKDSITVLLLVKEMTKEFINLFMASSIDLPGSLEHAQKISWGFNVPLIVTNPEPYYGTFVQWVRRIGYWPTIEHNWCNTRLKIRPMRTQLNRMWGRKKIKSKLTGVRRYESSRRRLMYKADQVIYADPEHAGSLVVHPILNWTDSDVIQFLDRHDIKLESPLYKQTGVSGCYWCPYYQESIIERVERVFPGIYDEIVELEEELGKPSLSNHRYLKDVIFRVRAQLPLPI